MKFATTCRYCREPLAIELLGARINGPTAITRHTSTCVDQIQCELRKSKSFDSLTTTNMMWVQRPDHILDQDKAYNNDEQTEIKEINENS